MSLRIRALRTTLCYVQAAKKQEKIQLAQQTAFEVALARNDAIHEERLRHARGQADERSARSAEVAMNAVAAAAQASFACQSRQADAAVSAMAAASTHSYNQQGSAPNAPTEVLMKLQVSSRTMTGFLTSATKICSVLVHLPHTGLKTSLYIVSRTIEGVRHPTQETSSHGDPP